MNRYPSRSACRGFTLIEIMAVAVLVAIVIVIVPISLTGFGARSRLDMAANTLVSALSAAREQAVNDGYTAYLELGWYHDEDAEEHVPAYRYRFTNIAVDKAVFDEDEADRRRIDRPDEREWVTTGWFALPDDVYWLGVSHGTGRFQRVEPEDEPFQVEFHPNGHIASGLVIRIESRALEDVDREFQIRTILVNPLTSEATWKEGEHGLPEPRDESAFN